MHIALHKIKYPTKAEPPTVETPRIPKENPTRAGKTHLIDLHRQANAISLKSVHIHAQQGGHYFSPFKGRGMEFDEVRPYQAGDDARTLDWRVTARTGKPHTKLFREERERSVLFWVDYRVPMFFATQGRFKSVVAARAAALLAWSAMNHGNRLGGLVFSEQQHEEMRPQCGKKGVLHLIQSLTEHQAWERSATPEHQEASARQALLRLRRVARPGSLVFLISDFRSIGTDSESHLAQLSRHNDVVMIFIYDRLEVSLPPPGLYRICDRTRELTLDTSAPPFRERHQERFRQREAILRSLCRRYGITCIPCATSDDLLITLQRGLGLNTRRRGA
ncbi:MAG: DUF58 domain-containing protein [Nitrospiria bacterium]